MKTRLVFTLIFIALNLCSAMENKSPLPKWEVGLSFGGMQFFRGNYLSAEYNYRVVDHWQTDVNKGIGGNIKYNISPVFSIQGEYLSGSLSGYYSDQRKSGIINSNYTFDTSLQEANLNILVDVFNLFYPQKYDRYLSPFGKVGVGAGFLTDKQKNIENPTTLMASMGLGIKLRLSEQIRLNAESTLHIGSDNLDSQIEEREDGIPFVENYVFTGFSISYRINSGNDKSPNTTKEIKPKRKKNMFAGILPKKGKAPKTTHTITTLSIIDPDSQYDSFSLQTLDSITNKLAHEIKQAQKEKQMSTKGWPIQNGAVYGELPDSRIIYRVQFIALRKQDSPNEIFRNMFLEYEKPYKYEGDGYIKYALGAFKSYKEAKVFLDELNSISDELSCFIVAFIDGIQLK